MRLRVLIVALLAVGVLIPTVLVLTQQRAAAASMVLSILAGTADVARGGAAFTRAPDGTVFNPGDRVRTATTQSHAVVTFLDGSTMEIEPSTTHWKRMATVRPLCDPLVTARDAAVRNRGGGWHIRDFIHAAARSAPR